MEESHWVNNSDSSILIVLGDPCQVGNEINGDAVTLDFFKKNGFTIINADRVEGDPPAMN